MSEPTKDYRIIKLKPRSRKLRPRVDLVAMVSVSFLLIMFFMVNQAMSRPQAMDLGVPNCGPGYGYGSGCIDSRRQITLLLDGNDKIIFYRGLFDFPDEKPKVVDYGKNGIRKELTRLVRQVPKISGFQKMGAIVLIKPSKKCTYRNLIDILDEMAISKVSTYVIVNDFTPEESKLLSFK